MGTRKERLRMGNREAKLNSLMEHMSMLLEDGPDIIRLLENYNYSDNAECLEIITTLPSAVNIDVFIATVNRWREIQRRYNKPLRVYAFSYNTKVEKIFMRLVQEHDEILLTPIPGVWKGDVRHA